MKQLAFLLVFAALGLAQLSAAPVGSQPSGMFDWAPQAHSFNAPDDLRFSQDDPPRSVVPSIDNELGKPYGTTEDARFGRRPPDDCGQVPEPATLALTGLALVVGGWLRRR